ncbi:MAG: hypothetical protein HF300_05565 [Ignavibacteria bacterium]|jgi:predicted GH43/DUF377 family glycosyl hydrolase/catabolite regulation protein CreA|nr:hypothetical protein [Ignavibacteria bacterium]MCU7500507.1 hypothetical protein [Ignavibacteria bacterium]MCU7512006.1 hypothetical protein [Ignavibacteria bacterium]MCU7521294.1 hypothetical protein [Ignavibacteria bacterium]MCU7525737.1 hypothetical protein [Ignavibacteria bacterium]
MKRFIGIVLISLSAFCLSSCSKENTVEPGSKTTQTLGSVSFKIDKVNAPLEVTLVKAYLSRPDCDTLKKDLNIFADLSSSLADILFENIKTGSWHLRITAENNAGEVLYTGETDIMIEDSKTTEVYLTLTPKPSGVGSIYVSVRWGSTSWIDYPANPLFSIYDSPANPLLVSQGKVLYKDGKYKMWYLNTYYSAKADIGYSESVDGIHWNSASAKPVLSPGSAGAWDDYAVTTGAVLEDGGVYKMYYCGFHDQNGTMSVGLAVSQDGIYWEKHPSPVLTASSFEEKVWAGSVIKKDGTYYMFYNYAKINGDRAMCLATSTDGVQWTKYSGNPVLKANQSWEGSGIFSPSVIYDNGQFKMVYMNYYNDGFGMANSIDGINWTKKSEPFWKVGQLKWCTKIAYPYIGKFNNEYRLYYTGGDGTSLWMGMASTSVL